MKNLFVGNMSFQTAEADLRALFEPFGAITRVHLATDRETGRARGFAFVEMANDGEAAKAIAALDGKEVDGRKLKVNEARPKEDRGGGGGPRGGNSGGGGNRGGGGGGRGRSSFSTENYSEAARQPREPRW
jgi:RNA recognition motif-containing protein